MNTPNNDFDNTREFLLNEQNDFLNSLKEMVWEQNFETFKSNNLYFFDLLYTYKPKVFEIESFLSKHSYNLLKNCDSSNAKKFVEENIDDIRKGVIVFSVLNWTNRMIFASKESPISRAMKTVKEFLDKIWDWEPISEK